jgi:hypothetical protein
MLKKVKVFEIEPNTSCRKYKESAHTSLVDHPITEPSLHISPVWTPIIAAEVRKQLRPVQIECENCILWWQHTENLSL